MTVERAFLEDLPQILELQYASYQSEAAIHNDYTIQPLVQTLEEVVQEFHNGVILKGIDENGKIIGSVRGYVRDNTLYIGKLIVHPEWQGNGFGKQLLNSLEMLYPGLRYELFTSHKSIRNLTLYGRMGYKKFKEIVYSPEMILIYLEKIAIG